MVAATVAATLSVVAPADRAIMDALIAQLRDEIVGLKAQQAAKTREAAIIVDELKGVRELYQKNLVQLPRLNALERDAASIEGQRGQLIAAVAQAESRIAETEFQIIQIDEQTRADFQKRSAGAIDQRRAGEMLDRLLDLADRFQPLLEGLVSPPAGPR